MLAGALIQSTAQRGLRCRSNDGCLSLFGTSPCGFEAATMRPS